MSEKNESTSNTEDKFIHPRAVALYELATSRRDSLKKQRSHYIKGQNYRLADVATTRIEDWDIFIALMREMFIEK